MRVSWGKDKEYLEKNKILHIFFVQLEKKPYICSMNQKQTGPIGIFDSGFGGLSIFREIRHVLPEYDYIYLGDNARAPYGDLPYDKVYHFTRQAVFRMFDMGCPLVILACNTASARALRTIQRKDLPVSDDPTRRVLGVIRPTVERVEQLTYSRHIGLIGTIATVSSHSYDLEIAKDPTYFSQAEGNATTTEPVEPSYYVHENSKIVASNPNPVILTSRACPDWVPIIEAGKMKEMHGIVKNDLAELLDQDPEIDTIILGCTHYPLITSLIQTVLQELDHPEIILMPQGKPVAYSLKDYLVRHPEMKARLSTEGSAKYLTSGDTARFEDLGSQLIGKGVKIHAEKLIW